MKNERSKEKIIPVQKSGSETGAVHEISAASAGEAKKIFGRGKKRLQTINEWKKYCAIPSMETVLTNAKGEEISTAPSIGDYIRIDVAGPGPRSGDGYDWVRIEEIRDTASEEHDEELFAMRVRPASNPCNDDEDTSHFYTSAATSTFIVERKGTTVCTAEVGKNEKPNVETKKITDKIRNALVAAGGMAGLSSAQWKMLMKGILDKAS